MKSSEYLVQNALVRCTRELLQAGAEAYIASQGTGTLDTLFNGAAYLENNKPIAVKAGLLSKPMTADHVRHLLDTTQCATYSEVIITDAKNPYVIGTQIRFNTTADGKLKGFSIDSIDTTTGDWLFNATKSLSLVQGEDWAPIPEGKRDSRGTIQQAGDAYLDLWGNSSAQVPWGTPCERMEGSAYTGKGTAEDSCNVGIPSGKSPPNTDRRYVVDETMGSVNILCTFQTMRNAPDSHELRLVDGKLRYVHTMTVMRRNQTMNTVR
ncbi:hypothetical protein GQ53DRAFT_888118 [Thozetella sp. PMI_491]|nr:hypothetical protein GQ53DRAFT_888118 [Thozetella sp. PMI_491]